MAVKKEGGQWYMRFQIRGHRYHEPTGARTKEGAKERESERRLELIESDNPRLKKAPPLKEFSTQFLQFVADSNKLKPNTKRSYRNGWRMLAATKLAARRLTDIYPSDVDTITFPGSGSNANQALRTLQRMLSLAVERRYLQAAPPIALREERKRSATISDSGMEDLLLELASPILRDFMVIMLDAGPRPEEIARLRRSDILWAEHAIHIRYGKSKKAERYIPLTERMADVLRERVGIPNKDSNSGRNPDWVFPSAVFGETENHRRAQAMAAEGAWPAEIARVMGVSWPTAKRYLSAPLKVGSASVSGHVNATSVGGKMWRELIERANAEIVKRRLPPLPEGLVLYSCRHTFATRFLKASGNDRAALKEIMGHSSFAVTERYVHGGIGAAAETMNEFNRNRRKPVVLGKRA
jgi:integrase